MELQDTTRGIRTSVYVYVILSVHRFKFRLGAKNPALVGFLHLSPMNRVIILNPDFWSDYLSLSQVSLGPHSSLII